MQVGKSPEEMMSEIYKRGPITCSVACDDRFDYGYDGGIFNDTTLGVDDIDHDVEVGSFVRVCVSGGVGSTMSC